MSDRLRTELFVNQVAQQLVPWSDAESWFHGRSETEQRDVIRSLEMMIGQAHPGPEIVERSFAANDRSTARAMLRARPLKIALRKMSELPRQELPRTFHVLMGVFQEADAERRRRHCFAGCSHWWHQDLSVPDAYERVLASFARPAGGADPAR
jgi:hypothetical protein